MDQQWMWPTFGRREQQHQPLQATLPDVQDQIRLPGGISIPEMRTLVERTRHTALV